MEKLLFFMLYFSFLPVFVNQCSRYDSNVSGNASRFSQPWYLVLHDCYYFAGETRTSVSTTKLDNNSSLLCTRPVRNMNCVDCPDKISNKALAADWGGGRATHNFKLHFNFFEIIL